MSAIFRFATFKKMLAVLLTLGYLGAAQIAAAETYTTKPFSGSKVNGGTATFQKKGDKAVLTLSNDFKVPDTPDPHWQVVDSQGKTYLLQRLGIKGDKINKSITLPPYVKDVAKVQIWCAYAETLLGEAPFEKPAK